MRVIGEVRAAVEDWPQMRASARSSIAAELRATRRRRIEPGDMAEARRLPALARGPQLHLPRLPRLRPRRRRTARSRLAAVARLAAWGSCARPSGAPDLARASTASRPACAPGALEPYLLNLTKANSRATVHRPAYLDYVGVKRFDADGQRGRRAPLPRPLHAHRLPRQPARHPDPAPQGATPCSTAPPSRRQPQREGADRDPRDPPARRAASRPPSTSCSTSRWASCTSASASACACSCARDAFGRFLSCLVFVPRDRFNTENRRRIERILRDAFGAAEHRLHDARLGVGARAPALHGLRRAGQPARATTPREIERRLVAATRSWADDLEQRAGRGARRGARATRCTARWGDAFPAAYRADWVARSAVADISRIEALAARTTSAISLYRPLEAAPRHAAREALPRGHAAGALGHAAAVREHGRARSPTSARTR